MTKEREALKLAQRAIEAHNNGDWDAASELFGHALPAIKEALAQPEQRPISDVTEAVTKTVIQVEKLLCEKLGKQWQPSGISISTLVDELALRTTPPQRTWVGLTDEDCFEALKAVDPEAKRLPLGFSMYAANIQAKLMGKNT